MWHLMEAILMERSKPCCCLREHKQNRKGRNLNSRSSKKGVKDWRAVMKENGKR